MPTERLDNKQMGGANLTAEKHDGASPQLGRTNVQD